MNEEKDEIGSLLKTMAMEGKISPKTAGLEGEMAMPAMPVEQQPEPESMAMPAFRKVYEPMPESLEGRFRRTVLYFQTALRDSYPEEESDQQAGVTP